MEKLGRRDAAASTAPHFRGERPGMTGDSGPLWKKWAWFIGLWVAGVAAVGAVGGLLRWWLHP